MATHQLGGTLAASWRGLDPFRWAWRLLTNVKFALVLVGTATLASMVGVLLPQVPGEMRGNPAARAAWIELRREDFGALTGPMDRFDLFDVFHSPWFVGLWGMIIVAVTVCTVSRIRPTVRAIHRPPLRVSDRFFESAHHRASFAAGGGAEHLAGVLRRRRYQVRYAGREGEAEYLFAQRFGWSQYGTFLSHLALLMLLVGGLLTNLAGFQRVIALADGRPAAPVFDDPGSDQIFVTMVDAVRGVDAEGNIVDFHSDLEIRRGDEAVTCTATVNGPCSAFGYRFHQAAFFNDIALLRITGPDGRVLFDDILDFNNETTAVPHLLAVAEDGSVVFDQTVPQMATFSPGGGEGDVGLAELAFPTGADGAMEAFDLSWQWSDDVLVMGIAGAGIDRGAIRPGDTVEAEGVSFTYRGPVAVPAITVLDMPRGPDSPAVAQMHEDGSGRPYLYVTGVGDEGLVLRDGAPRTTASGYSYEFGGRLDASGIDVRRDPGDTFIWIAVVMALIGLALTFWVPRRRLWARVTPERTYLAAAGERTTRLSRELEAIGEQAVVRERS